MCTIDRMLIKGIRSFSPNNSDVVVFYKPLTLIVGANGAGKTTIIECLKQACTGELPPNTRSGQSFIHDPKVAHETEVKAQIKLRFKITGQRVTVLRSFQLSQKKTALQFKTLDSTIMLENLVTGESKAVTYKCADIDKMVPQLMGVSKAVLEYVIFVHQEDSNWPLAEGKVLKERFDDIFAATKYTKALETLRKLKAEKSQQVKELKLKFEVLRNQRNTAQMHQDQLANAEHEHAMAVEQSRQLEAEVQEEVRKVEQLQRAKDELVKLSQEVQMCLVRIEEYGKQAAGKRAQLGDFDVPDATEELAATLRQFDATIDNTRIRAARLKGEIQTKNMQVQTVRDNLNKMVQRHSKLQAEQGMYEQCLKERDEFIRSTAASLHLPLPGIASLPPGAVLPDAFVASFQAALKQHVADATAALAQAKDTNRQRDSQLSSAVDKLTTSLTQQQEQLRIKRQQMEQNIANVQGLNAQADAMVVNESNAVAAQRRVDEAEDAVRAKNEELVRQDLDNRLVKEKRDIDELGNIISSVRQERDRIAGASEAATRLRVKQQELMEKKEALVASLHNHRPKLLQLLSTADLPPVEQLKSSSDAALARKKEQHRQQQLQLQQLQTAESQARAELTAARDMLASHEQQRTQLLTQLRARLPATMELPVSWEPGQAVANERLLEKALNDRKMALETAKEKLTTQEAMKKYLNRLRKMMCEEKSCPACYRGFSSDQELQHSLTQLDEGVREQPRRLEQLQQQVATVQAAHDGLLAMQPSWRKLLDIEAHAIPDMLAKIRPLEQALTVATVAASNASEAVSEVQRLLNETTQLVGEAVWQIDRQSKEVAALQGEVEAAAIGSQSGGAAGRTLADIDNELDEAEVERSTKELARESMLKRQSRLKEELFNLMREVTAAKDALTAHKSRLLKKQELLQKAAELEAANIQLQAEVASLDASVKPSVAERDQAVQRRDQMRETMRADEERLEAALRTARQLLDSYNQRVVPIQQYEAQQQGAELARAAASVEEAKNGLKRLEKDIDDKEREEQQATEELAQQESYRHKLQDVLELRAVESKLKGQEDRVTQLQAKQREVGREADINVQLRTALSDKELLQKKLDMLAGSCVTQQQIIKREQAALRQPEYKDIIPRYNKGYAEFTYTELAVGDLDKYHKALEKALLSFHTTKMADINKIIKELWQKTYRGQDIDYIQIKADADGQRSYNYRVVMYCAGAELDMRGRCSAGQKVLACLIIRLALAETFCLNCGILALDEPTTNLDADNAASLAEALRAVMLARREQENFQLIVITHDEKFAHLIGTREQAETLWRITKNDSGHTHIGRELIE